MRGGGGKHQAFLAALLAQHRPSRCSAPRDWSCRAPSLPGIAMCLKHMCTCTLSCTNHGCWLGTQQPACAAPRCPQGSLVRAIRRLEELLRQVAGVLKAVGEAGLGERFEAAIARIKRDIVFAASLYL